MFLSLMGISIISSFCKDTGFRYGNSAICTNASLLALVYWRWKKTSLWLWITNFRDNSLKVEFRLYPKHNESVKYTVEKRDGRGYIVKSGFGIKALEFDSLRIKIIKILLDLWSSGCLSSYPARAQVWPYPVALSYITCSFGNYHLMNVSCRVLKIFRDYFKQRNDRPTNIQHKHCPGASLQLLARLPASRLRCRTLRFLESTLRALCIVSVGVRVLVFSSPPP